MVDARPAFVPSASFSASTSSSPARSLKRRLFSAPDLNFFVPAEDTFKPLPYTPHHHGTSRERPPERPAVPPVPSHTLSTLSLDPLPTDPEAIFLRFPFTTFPDQAKYPEGVTYTALAENPNWFLDAQDYASEHSTNPDAVPYPSALEPPRGWCPTKKKDVKEKGADVWPDGEQPRLRCTFCRRTYAGVNAKSMWRRHVFEKHKIAMANRRTDVERRGRASNKENKRVPGKAGFKKSDSHEPLPKTEDDAESDSLLDPLPPSPTLVPRVVPPASPYDPLLYTPSFRHSPPRLPSDQPWRFPSPSHPMHWSRELSLTMLGDSGPVSNSPIVFPKTRFRASTTPASSPCTPRLSFVTPESFAPLPRALLFSPGLELASSSPCKRARTLSDVSDDWNSVSTFMTPPPFRGNAHDSPPSSSPEAPSSAVQSGAHEQDVGLLEPFTLPNACPPTRHMDIDELIHLRDENDEDEVEDALLCSQASTNANIDLPPLKRRRTTT
ncbi:hypothetical protein R3P38DRAFT_2822681 [Favolaschia claudopus]|uniref:BED-type domain-containing protein n=1 Tax=Favolaschia claudopus TaxID=2862362 RepID=A0AAW0EF33_9AGAR